jgi:hypothetical protein
VPVGGAVGHAGGSGGQGDGHQGGDPGGDPAAAPAATADGVGGPQGDALAGGGVGQLLEAAAAVGGQVHGHPPDPGLGCVVVAQPRPAGRGARVRLLHDLLGLVQVTGHREQDAEQPADGGRVELLESLGVGHVLGFRVGKV